jgi:hypothetical protein
MKTRCPGWTPDREGYDFSDDDDDLHTQEEINEDNEKFAQEYRKSL